MLGPAVLASPKKLLEMEMLGAGPNNMGLDSTAGF